MNQRRKWIWAVAVGVMMSAGAARAAVQSIMDVAQTLRVDLDLVLVPVSVTDHAGQPVTGLSAADFQLWEDRVEQQIEYVSSEAVPASIGVLLDVSNSMRDILPIARNAITTFLDAGTAEDEFFLIEFNDQPRVTEDFTADVGLLRNRLFQTPPIGQTALYDAVYQGIAKAQSGSNARKALLIVTDGEDNRSRYSRSNLEEYVRESGIQIYAIGISASFGRGALRELTEMTGGRVEFAGRDADLEEIARRIAVEMKGQYVLGYLSSNSARNGAWRDVRVRVQRDPPDAPVTVRARRGYYASIF